MLTIAIAQIVFGYQSAMFDLKTLQAVRARQQEIKAIAAAHIQHAAKPIFSIVSMFT